MFVIVELLKHDLLAYILLVSMLVLVHFLFDFIINKFVFLSLAKKHKAQKEFISVLFEICKNSLQQKIRKLFLVYVQFRL